MSDYKLVPVEPTEGMIDAARDQHEGEPYLPVSLYKAMLAAAPDVQGELVGYVRPHQLEALLSGKLCGITMEDKPDAHNRVTVPLYTSPPAVPEWQPIETAPKSGDQPLLLAQFSDDGGLMAFDYDGSWESDSESWEQPEVYYFWASAKDCVEEPTHWMYQPDWFVQLPKHEGGSEGMTYATYCQCCACTGGHLSGCVVGKLEQQITELEGQEPVGWQFYQHGEWWYGDDRIKDHRKNTEEAGFLVRDVYAAPQPAEQQPAPDVSGLVEAPINISYIDGNGAARSSPTDCRYGVRYVTVADTVYWPLSADDAQLLRSAECGRGDFTGPASTSTNVAPLVEALTELCDEIDKHEIHAAISKTSISWFKRKARKALAAYRKGAQP